MLGLRPFKKTLQHAVRPLRPLPTQKKVNDENSAFFSCSPHVSHCPPKRRSPNTPSCLGSSIWCGVGPPSPRTQRRRFRSYQFLSTAPIISTNLYGSNFGSILALLIRCLPSRCWSSKTSQLWRQFRWERMENPDNHIKLEPTISPRIAGYPAWIPKVFFLHFLYIYIFFLLR